MHQTVPPIIRHFFFVITKRSVSASDVCYVNCYQQQKRVTYLLNTIRVFRESPDVAVASVIVPIILHNIAVHRNVSSLSFVSARCPCKYWLSYLCAPVAICVRVASAESDEFNNIRLGVFGSAVELKLHKQIVLDDDSSVYVASQLHRLLRRSLRP